MSISTAVFVVHQLETSDSPESNSSEPSIGEMARLSADVTSNDLGKVKSAFGIRFEQDLNKDFLSAQKTWKSLSIKSSTYQTTGKSTGHVAAVMKTNNGDTQRWKLGLAQADDAGWFIVTTVEMSP